MLPKIDIKRELVESINAMSFVGAILLAVVIIAPRVGTLADCVAATAFFFSAILLSAFLRVFLGVKPWHDDRLR
ncbi:hypothetical protein [Candidatus Burkholderia verschuerenii]|uniref:hypothetical protein n=1 Tax=Candidatus Burkholderia verschuerenii TaxID=242163 RepID=UPI00067E3CBB|nr:hypothetical protein [Candidatus Burkholderia verschuerenii]